MDGLGGNIAFIILYHSEMCLGTNPHDYPGHRPVSRCKIDGEEKKRTMPQIQRETWEDGGYGCHDHNNQPFLLGGFFMESYPPDAFFSNAL